MMEEPFLLDISYPCFSESADLDVDEQLMAAPLRLPFGHCRSFGNAIEKLGLANKRTTDDEFPLVFGTRIDARRGLQITYDSWTAAVAPVTDAQRLPERDQNSLAGVLGGALGISEIFQNLAGISVDACRRAIGLSLWRPELNWLDPEGVGKPIEYLPNEVWMLGLGHLGQASLWCLGLLPYSDPAAVRVTLNDLDYVEEANYETGLLTERNQVGDLKTRVTQCWLEERGFRPRLVEHAFQEGWRVATDDPKLALCGFDDKGPRHCLDEVGFEFVACAGVGGRHDNFDAIACHSIPHSRMSAREIWPPGAKVAITDETAILSNRFYRDFSQKARCGHVDLASIAVAVPFVGAVAGSITLANVLRLLHGGKVYDSVHIRLDSPETVWVEERSTNSTANIAFQRTIDSIATPVST